MLWNWLASYWLFVLELLTTLMVLGGLVMFILAIRRALRREHHAEWELSLTPVHQELEVYKEAVIFESDLPEARKQHKREVKKAKKHKKPKGRVFILKFKGDGEASESEALSQEVSAILLGGRSNDLVLLNLESPGGGVSDYGFAAAQLERLRAAKMKLHVCVDKVAASGGYMMACVGDRIFASSFAYIGSIGVVSVVPSFHKALKRQDVEVRYQTAGKYKRTLTLFGEDSKEAEEKHKAELEEIHTQFKALVSRYRPEMDMDRVATGEFWLGEKARELGLVDEIKVFDEYLLELYREGYEIYHLEYFFKKSLADRFSRFAQSLGTNLRRGGLLEPLKHIQLK